MCKEADDFENDKEIQSQRKAKKEYTRMFDECIRIISDELSLEPASHKNMKTFLMFKALQTPILTHSLKSKTGNLLQVSVVEYYSEYKTAKYIDAGSESYFFGMVTLKTNYPSTYISRETIREKITDMFLKQDVDFPEQKKFSRKFHVVSKSREKLMQLLYKKPLDGFAIFPEMEIELNGNKGLFRSSRKSVSLAEAKKFASLANMVKMVLD